MSNNKQDRARVAGGQEYEVKYEAEKGCHQNLGEGSDQRSRQQLKGG